ncbi:hypothetical protein D3C72_1614190 [compost metagenome]
MRGAAASIRGARASRWRRSPPSWTRSSEATSISVAWTITTTLMTLEHTAPSVATISSTRSGDWPVRSMMTSPTPWSSSLSRMTSICPRTARSRSTWTTSATSAWTPREGMTGFGRPSARRSPTSSGSSIRRPQIFSAKSSSTSTCSVTRHGAAPSTASDPRTA